ncbi:hypothetical protein [Chroococcidiopsis sp. CCMEE 29]|nr:hypothetical protein [Chroococcidiopsis sp. CCMEE 29]
MHLCYLRIYDRSDRTGSSIYNGVDYQSLYFNACLMFVMLQMQ